MSAHDLLEARIRNQLEAEVVDVLASPDLATEVRLRKHRRTVRRGGLTLGICAALAAAAASIYGVVAPRNPSPSTIDLAGYSVSLPPGVHASSLQFTTPSTFPVNPPSPSMLVQCRVTGVGALMNSPAAWGPPPYRQPALSNFVITAPSGSGCVSGLMTLPYGSGMAPIPDAVAPSGAQSVQIDSYPTRELDSSTPAFSDYAYYVQLPASGGGFQDLIVAALGLPQNEVVGLVQQVVAQYEQGAPGTATTSSSS